MFRTTLDPVKVKVLFFSFFLVFFNSKEKKEDGIVQ
jgi:hypothetical protein